MTDAIESAKQQAAESAIEYVQKKWQADWIIGVGTGSTADYFIDWLEEFRYEVRGAIASSRATERRLRAIGIPLFTLEQVDRIPIYIDGADEVDSFQQMIKGGGGALTREKLLASVADEFVCIADFTKRVDALGTFPVPVECTPFAIPAISHVAKELGGAANTRRNYVTDNGCPVVDISGLQIRGCEAAQSLEERLTAIPGVLSCGIFAKRAADTLIVATERNGLISHRT